MFLKMYVPKCQWDVPRIKVSHSHWNIWILICLCDQDEAYMIQLDKIVSMSDKQDNKQC